MGISSTIWFLITGHTKTFPGLLPLCESCCSYNVRIYYLSAFHWGISLTLRKAWKSLRSARLYPGISLASIYGYMLFVKSYQRFIRLHQLLIAATGPEDGPNMPFGKGNGINPGQGDLGLESRCDKRELQKCD